MPQESRSLRCELVTEFSRLQLLAPAWERLNENCGSVFQSWGWARAFWQAHGHELMLCAPVIFAGDVVVGIVPLAVRNKTLRLLGDPYADYNGPLCLKQHALLVLNTALAALLDAPFRWTECIFNNLPEGFPLLQPLQCPAWQLQRHLQTVFQYSCPAALDDGTGVFERLANKDRLRRREKRLERHGSLEFRHIEDRQEIQEHLDEFFAQHTTRRALNGGRSLFLDPAPRAMMRALVDELDPARELRFCALELNGRAIAYHFGFQRAGKFIFYAPSFDADYWDDSPGDVLLRNLFQYVHKEKLSEFDFTVGDEAYKERFANLVRTTWSAYFYRAPRQPQAQILRAGRSMRDIVRRNPRAAQAARWAKKKAERGAESLRQPGVAFRSAAAALAALFSLREEIVCHRVRPLHDAAGRRVRRAGVRELAQLKIDNAISQGSLHALRRRLRQGEGLYVVSLHSGEYLFWLRENGDAATPSSGSRISFEASTLVGRGMHGPAEALVALLCNRQSSGPVCLEVPRWMPMDEVLQRAGYRLQSRCTYIAALGRPAGHFPQPAICLAKERD